MKKTLTALIIAGLAFCNASAQQTQINACGIKQHKVCRENSNKKTSCYNTHSAANFQVCQSDEGYYICCETPGPTNSTYTEFRSAVTAAGEFQVERARTYTGNRRQIRDRACGETQNEICKVSPDKKRTSCYKTKNAQNFKVCSNENGYYICCETPGKNNSTFTEFPVTPVTEGEGE